MKRLDKIILLTLISITWSGMATAMSIFDAGKVCTFSSISGIILNDGHPVKNALVTRITDYTKKKQDETTTDENGHFSFPAAFERSIAKFLPQEFTVGQTLLVNVEGKEVEIWNGVKRKKEENSESKGKPLMVTCELTREKQVIEVDRQPFITLCTWDVEPNIPDTGF